MSIQRIKGTQDILPDAVWPWQVLEKEIRRLCWDYGYHEIRTPVFESTSLFVRGVGATSDIVEKEMYTFEDEGKRSLTLRPEGTAPVCRAYVENKLYGLPQPQKLYYIGPMFRSENPQSMRFRQFHQFGVEVLGADEPIVDAEVIQLAAQVCQNFGVKGLETQINSLGCPECRAVHREQLLAFLEPKRVGFCELCRSRLERNPMRVLDCKNPECQRLTQGAPTTFSTLCGDCHDHFDRVQDLLQLARVDYKVNPRLVRGLDYYRKTAFEIVETSLGSQNAICGGGRYDALVEEIGGPPTPGMGFALGIERLLKILQDQQIEPDDTRAAQFVTVAALGQRAQDEAFRIVSRLRRKGIPANMDLMGRSLKSQLRTANRDGTRYAVIIGEDELVKNLVVIRDMTEGEQFEVALEDSILWIEKRLFEAN
ncbi:MAG: histidine--tRNA ligase [Peptococcaceae bacterium]|nr:histidine--tRNA ligase [Peptococcaceae bacterium]